MYDPSYANSVKILLRKCLYLDKGVTIIQEKDHL